MSYRDETEHPVSFISAAPPTPRPVPFQYNVVEYTYDLGVNEPSTLKSKQTVCLGVALKSCLLTKKRSALGFLKGPMWQALSTE